MIDTLAKICLGARFCLGVIMFHLKESVVKSKSLFVNVMSQLFDPVNASYSSLVRVLAATSLRTHAFTVKLGGKYEVLKVSKRVTFAQVVALLAVLLHLILALGWVKINWSKTKSWQLILVSSFLVIFIGTAAGLFVLGLIREEVVFLLNMAELLERTYLPKGMRFGQHFEYYILEWQKLL